MIITNGQSNNGKDPPSRPFGVYTMTMTELLALAKELTGKDINPFVLRAIVEAIKKQM
jgi:hypothetical protein